jgi:cytochrome c551/c552
MISAVLIFGKEKKKAEAASTPPAATSPAPSAPTTTGNATAGKAVFAANGCNACHTFTPAAATGKIGPDLDKLAESAATAKQPLDAFIEQSIVDPNAFAPGYAKASCLDQHGTSLSKTQLADLVVHSR